MIGYSDALYMYTWCWSVNLPSWLYDFYDELWWCFYKCVVWLLVYMVVPMCYLNDIVCAEIMICVPCCGRPKSVYLILEEYEYDSWLSRLKHICHVCVCMIEIWPWIWLRGSLFLNQQIRKKVMLSLKFKAMIVSLLCEWRN